MSAASRGDTAARVVIPDPPELEDLPSRLGVALNVLLDDLWSRAAAAERSSERLRILADASHEFSATTHEPERLLSAVARRLAMVVRDMCAVRLLSGDG